MGISVVGGVCNQGGEELEAAPACLVRGTVGFVSLHTQNPEMH